MLLCGVRAFSSVGVGAIWRITHARKSAEMFSDHSKVRGTEQAERDLTMQSRKGDSDPRIAGLLDYRLQGSGSL